MLNTGPTLSPLLSACDEIQHGPHGDLLATDALAKLLELDDRSSGAGT